MQITITVPPEYLARIDASAAAMGLSRSAFIRMRVSGLSGGEPLSATPTVAALEPAPNPVQDAETILDRLGWKRYDGPVVVYYAESDRDALDRLLSTPPQREVRGVVTEPPAGYHLVTVMEQDLGKDAWMSAADAGITV